MNVAGKQPGADMATGDFDTIAISDERYPPLLRTICDPPETLYVRGDCALLSQPQLAMVGSRRASAAGLRAARLFSDQAVAASLHVCSGLALGIDGAAHRGALAAGGNSIAVLATGIDRVYPARHRGLADELLRAGCLVTEFAPGTRPHRGNFPRRNRIISGLSLGVLVVEAALPSGSLITARSALEQGREVFALPWSMLHEGGAGCLHLIRDGAKMVTCMDDIVEELGSLFSLHRDLAPAIGPDQSAPLVPPAAAADLLSLLGFEAISLDALVIVTGKSIDKLLVELSALELAGLVVRCPGGYIRS